MPPEPINLFSARGDAEQVRNLVLARFPDAKVTVDGDDWTEIAIRFEGGLRLVLLHRRDYYTGQGWARQKAGMQGYFSRFPLGDREKQTMSTIGTFQFSLATRFDPDYEPFCDPRLTFLSFLAEQIDAVFFSPSGLRDARFRILVSADGEVDAAATWPIVGMTVTATPFGDASVDAENDRQPDPPTARRVARRAVALAALTARAVLERDYGRRDSIPEEYDWLRDRITEIGTGDEFEPWEQMVIDTPPGQLDRQKAVNAMWRIEGLEVLAWALGLKALPRYDAMSDVDDVWKAVGFPVGAAAKLVASPKLRPTEELGTFRKQMLGYHWRLTDFRWTRPEKMDFRAFAAKCWFGSFDLTGFDLIDNELAIQGQRLDEADGDVFGLCQSIAAERHRAANWLCWGPGVYSDTDVST